MIYKRILELIYQEKNPDKINDITILLEKYAGQEAELLNAIYKKYSLSNDEILQLENGNNPFEKPEKPEIDKEISSPDSINNSKPPKKSSSKTVFIALIVIIVVATITVVLINQLDFFKEEKVDVEKKEVVENNEEISFYEGQEVVAIEPRVYFYSEANDESITQSFFIKGQDATILGIEKDFLLVSFNYNNKTTEGYVYKNQVVGKSKLVNISTTASSEMESESELTYFAENVIDDDLFTWWSPEVASIEEWIKINFGKNWIKGVKIHAGAHYPDHENYGNLYYKNSRVTQAKLEFSDGSTEIINISENDRIETFFFEPRLTKSVKLVPLSWNSGSAWQDICISHFEVF